MKWVKRISGCAVEVTKKTPFFTKNNKIQDDIDNILEKCTFYERNIRHTAEEVKEALIKL